MFCVLAVEVDCGDMSGYVKFAVVIECAAGMVALPTRVHSDML